MTNSATERSEIEIYVHSEGSEDPKLVRLERTAFVRDLLGSEDEEHLLWTDEQDEPLDVNATLETSGVRHRDHVHRGRCRTVHVEVRYNSDRIHRDFRQVAKIKRVFEWAVGDEGFNLASEQRAKHVLALPNADHFLNWNVHVGSLVISGSCRVVLDLVPRERFEG